ncbi:MAG: DUF4349 domain-containing protein [Treponema sp.]|nr:DUF4349 domain-containing protein [Treponema sp.]
MKLSIKNLVKIAVSVCLVVFALLSAGCSKKSYKSSAVQSSRAALKESKIAGKGFNSVMMADAAVYDDYAYELAEESIEAYESPAVPASNAVPEPVEGAAEYERKLIRTGNVSLEVQTVSDAEEKINAWIKSLGGFVTNASTWENGANFTVRVPSARFDDAMAQTGNFGRVTNRSVNSQDVSDNYYDLQSRLQTKYILRDKLSGYLSQAKDIKDLLEIERQLNSVLEDIDSTEGRFKRLSGQIDYSTIYINMQFERGKDEGGIILPDVKDSWNEFVSNVIRFFWGLLKILFYIVIFGIPLVGLAAFFFWLLFGKVGLLIKLFKKLKK